MSGSNRLDSILNKLSTTSNKSNEDLMNALINTGINLGEAYVTYNKQEQSLELENSLNDLSTTIKTLDYTQSGMDIEIDGETVDMYDFKRDITTKAFDNFKEVANTPFLKKRYGDANALVEESVTGILAYQDTMRTQRDKNVGELTSLMGELEALFIKDPLLNKDIDSRQGAIDIVENIKDTRAHTEAVSGKKILDQHTVPLAKLKQEYETIMSLYEADIDKSKEGLQVNLSDEYSPYLKEFLKDRGLEETELESGLTELTLPEGKRVSTANYADAIKSFDIWHTAQLASQGVNIKQIAIAEDKRPLEKIRDWMEVGDPNEQDKAKAIGFALFADPKQGNPYLDALELPTPWTDSPLQVEIEEEISRLKSLKNTGKYPQEFKDMQTRYNAMLKSERRGQGKTVAQMNDSDISKIRFNATNLNNTITGYNASFDANDLKNITKVPVFFEKTLGATTKESKGAHLLVLDKILKADDSEEFMGNNAWNEEPLLKDFKDAKGMGKWIALRKLVDKYIDDNNLPQNEDEAIDVWDAKGLSPDEGQQRLNIFYAVLLSFKSLMLVDPYGTLEEDIIKPQ